MQISHGAVSGKQYLVMIDAYSKRPEVHELVFHATTIQMVSKVQKSDEGDYYCHMQTPSGRLLKLRDDPLRTITAYHKD